MGINPILLKWTIGFRNFKIGLEVLTWNTIKLIGKNQFQPVLNPDTFWWIFMFWIITHEGMNESFSFKIIWFFHQLSQNMKPDCPLIRLLSRSGIFLKTVRVGTFLVFPWKFPRKSVCGYVPSPYLKLN